MADISFNESMVKETITNVKTSYTNLESKISEMSKKCETLNSFWSSKEQEKFSEALANLNGMITKFNDKYESYLTLLESVITSYGTEKSNILAALESEKSKDEQKVS